MSAKNPHFDVLFLLSISNSFGHLLNASMNICRVISSMTSLTLVLVGKAMSGTGMGMGIEMIIGFGDGFVGGGFDFVW